EEIGRLVDRVPELDRVADGGRPRAALGDAAELLEGSRLTLPDGGGETLEQRVGGDRFAGPAGDQMEARRQRPRRHRDPSRGPLELDHAAVRGGRDVGPAPVAFLEEGVGGDRSLADLVASPAARRGEEGGRRRRDRRGAASDPELPAVDEEGPRV